MALPAGNTPGAASPLGTSTVNVSWAAATGGAPVTGYEVHSFDATTGNPRSVGGGCAGIVSATSCTETGVPNGSWKYTTTARLQLWSGAPSSLSSAVGVDTQPLHTTFPVAATAYTTASWDAGCAAKICGTTSSVHPIQSVAVSVREGSGNYWNGTAFASATEVLVAATGTTSWSLAFGGANFPADGTYTVRAVATDATAATFAVSTTFTIDRTVPTVAVTFPAAAGSYGTASWNAGCTSTVCGTAADGGSGLASAKVSIRQGTGNYWNGTAFASASEILNNATGTASWSLPFPAASFPADGSYTVRALVTDNAGLTATASRTFTMDVTAPVPTASALSNANGFADPKIDELQVTFSEALQVSTICSGWTGAADQSLGGAGVVVSVTDGGPTDTMTVTASGCNVGTLVAGNYVTTNATLSGSNAQTESRVMWTAATHVLTIHLGNLASGTGSGVAVPAGNVTYTPSAAFKDVAGNLVNPAGVVTANQHF
jgi:hypothetical protein